MFGVFAYTDLGLVTPAAVFFFGLTLGVIGALGRFATSPVSGSTEGSV
jgi:hypothetical protein